MNSILKNNQIVYEGPKKKKPFINAERALVRLHFAKKYVKKSDAFWRNVIFTDETKHDLTQL